MIKLKGPTNYIQIFLYVIMGRFVPLHLISLIALKRQFCIVKEILVKISILNTIFKVLGIFGKLHIG